MGYARMGRTHRELSQNVTKDEGSGVTELKGWQTSLEFLDLLSVNEKSYTTGQAKFSGKERRGLAAGNEAGVHQRGKDEH